MSDSEPPSLYKRDSLRVLAPQGLLAHPYSSKRMMVRHRGQRARREGSEPGVQIQMQIQIQMASPSLTETAPLHTAESDHTLPSFPVYHDVRVGSRSRETKEAQGRKFVTCLGPLCFDHALACTRPRCKSPGDPVTACGREADEGLCSGQIWVGIPAGEEGGRGDSDKDRCASLSPRRTRDMVACALFRGSQHLITTHAWVSDRNFDGPGVPRNHKDCNRIGENNWSGVSPSYRVGVSELNTMLQMRTFGAPTDF